MKTLGLQSMDAKIALSLIAIFQNTIIVLFIYKYRNPRYLQMIDDLFDIGTNFMT